MTHPKKDQPVDETPAQVSNEQCEALISELEADKVGAGAGGVKGPIADTIKALVVAFLKEWLANR